MKIREIDRDAIFKIGVAIGALLVGIALLYSQIIQPSILRKKLDECLFRASLGGLKRLEGLPNLPYEIEERKDECFKRYPAR